MAKSRSLRCLILRQPKKLKFNLWGYMENINKSALYQNLRQVESYEELKSLLLMYLNLREIWSSAKKLLKRLVFLKTTYN